MEIVCYQLTKFTFRFYISLKHHCRNCGEIFCNSCSEQLAPLPNDQGQFGKPVRVCDGCWEIINAPRN